MPDPTIPSAATVGPPTGDLIAERVSAAHEGQRSWALWPVAKRLGIVRRARESIALRAVEFARISAALRERPVTEVLSAEVLPLLEAHRFVEREGKRLLAPQKLGRRGRPFWLRAVDTEIHREPRGVVLVIGPGNYPLLLPGVQILQALAAGNSVLFKPAPGTLAVAEMLRDVWVEAGLPAGCFEVLSEQADAVHEVIRAGVNLVVLTGSAPVGEAVLKTCAETLTPSVMELSGCDAVIVREDADVELTARALAFGLRINNGATCIAPKRVFVARRLAEPLEARLARLLEGERLFELTGRFAEKCRKLLAEAEHREASVLAGGLRDGRLMLPLVISGGRQSRTQMEGEIFGPVLVITFVDDDEEAVALARCSAYALGASVFSRDEGAARCVAERLNAGVVLINDLIVPTADPRIPFGGRGRSGFGVTRGEEGLLAMTVPKVISVSKGRSRPHFSAVEDTEIDLFAGYIATAHGVGWRQRWGGMLRLWRGLRTFNRGRRQSTSCD